MDTEADYLQRRTRMVDSQLRTTDVTNPRVLDAMQFVPREEFVPPSKRSLAYIDEDIEIASVEGSNPARYLMEPSPFARLVQLAEISHSDFVLDIGCGTGYSSAVMSRLASSVVALESDPMLADLATANLVRFGFDNVAVVRGPLSDGHAEEAPFDVILFEGCVDFVPEPLFAQLKEGGRLVVVEGQGLVGKAKLYNKWNGVVTGRDNFNAAIRPLPGFQRAYTFQF